VLVAWWDRPDLMVERRTPASDAEPSQLVET